MADKEALVKQLNECAEKRDLEGAFKLVRTNLEFFAKELSAAGIRDALKKTTDDRLLLSLMDGVEFGQRPLDESLERLEKLFSFKAGSLVLNKTWGLGTVKRLDYFYKRITVDFKNKRGHQFTYAAAADMLDLAPENHILVFRQADPAAFAALLKNQPGEFVRRVIESNGCSMTLIRLEDYCVANGFVKSVNWKKFWDSARVELKADKRVVIPAKKADPIIVKPAAEDYGADWLTAFGRETDPKQILASVREYTARKEYKTADDAVKAKLEERLVFAVTAARKTDDALYARLACTVTELGFARPDAAEMREYLWERKRFVKAAAELPAREVGAMIAFLAVDNEAKEKLYKAIPDFCFAAVTEIVQRFGAEGPCRTYIGHYLRDAKCPPTVTTLVAGKYEQFKDWKELPPLVTILGNAIVLGEGRQGGETLKMQNIVRRLFASSEWLKKVFAVLTAEERSMLFERFQASIAWDVSTHTKIVIEMTKLDPELKNHVVKAEKKKEYARVTSFRSYGLRKQEYLKLINEDMPANVKRIEFAKGFGDLSENAEYQYAKDEQRALMQKQTLMQADLEKVKPDEFLDASVEEVMPGVTVVLSTPEGEKTYTILGEWDNDLDRGIISSKTRLAQNLLGKKAGDEFEMPGEGSTQFGKILQIKPLTDEIREWMKLPAGVQI